MTDKTFLKIFEDIGPRSATKEFLTIFGEKQTDAGSDHETIRGVPESVYRKFLAEAHRKTLRIISAKRRRAVRETRRVTESVSCAFKRTGCCGCKNCTRR